MGRAVTSQFIRHNFSWFTFVFLDHSTKKSLSCFSISPVLKKHINDFSILIYGSPKISLLATNLYKQLINKESISISLMPLP